MGACRNTIAKVINANKIEAAGKNAKGDLYELKQIAPLIYGGTIKSNADELGWKTDDNLHIKTPKDRKDYLESQKAELALAVECKKYIPVEEHIKDKRDALTIIVEFFNNFPSRLEREKLASPEQIDRLIKLSDHLRNHLSNELKRLY